MGAILPWLGADGAEAEAMRVFLHDLGVLTAAIRLEDRLGKEPHGFFAQAHEILVRVHTPSKYATPIYSVSIKDGVAQPAPESLFFLSHPYRPAHRISPAHRITFH